MNLQEIRNKLERKKGQKNQLLKNLNEARRKVRFFKKEVKINEKAQIIIQEVAKQTQDEIGYRLSELVVLSMATVFEDPYGFETIFIRRRGKTECDFYFTRNKQRFNPMRRSGGGTVDMASFALRATWAEGTLILDEPFRFISRELQPKVSLLLKEFSKNLNIQIIMITHSKALITNADKVFITSMKKGRSTIRPLNKNQIIRLLRSEL